MCLFPDPVAEMGLNFWGRRGALTDKPKEIMAAAFVIYFTFYTPFPPFCLMESTAQYHPVFPALLLPSSLISPSPQEAI